MRPRHPIFAEEYILETLEAFIYLADQPTPPRQDLMWAASVLQKYFVVIEPTALTEKCHLAFLNQVTQQPWLLSDVNEIYKPATSIVKQHPFRQRDLDPSPITTEQFRKLCLRRRSVRWFLSQSVPRVLIEQAVSIASLAPSACNRQPFRYLWFEKPECAAAIARIAMGTTGYAHQIPGLIVLVGDLSNFSHERDRHLPYVDASLSAMQFMLALETVGLASCPINWPDVESLEQKMQRTLALPDHERPIMLIAVGYPDPDGGVAFSAKKPLRDLLEFRYR